MLVHPGAEPAPAGNHRLVIESAGSACPGANPIRVPRRPLGRDGPGQRDGAGLRNRVGGAARQQESPRGPDRQACRNGKQHTPGRTQAPPPRHGAGRHAGVHDSGGRHEYDADRQCRDARQPGHGSERSQEQEQGWRCIRPHALFVLEQQERPVHDQRRGDAIRIQHAQPSRQIRIEGSHCHRNHQEPEANGTRFAARMIAQPAQAGEDREAGHQGVRDPAQRRRGNHGGNQEQQGIEAQPAVQIRQSRCQRRAGIPEQGLQVV